MSPPVPATVAFDGDCGFCRRVAARWSRRFAPRIVFVPFDDVNLPEASTQEFRSKVRFIGPDGTIYGGAHAVAEMFAFAGDPWPMRLYRIPGLRWLADTAYSIVGHHRKFFARFI